MTGQIERCVSGTAGAWLSVGSAGTPASRGSGVAPSMAIVFGFALMAEKWGQIYFPPVRK
jgi:hypothetical protein